MADERSEYELEQALVDEPRDRLTRVALSASYLLSGRYEAALEQARITLALAPDDLPALGLAALSADMLGDRITSIGCMRVMHGLRALDESGGELPTNAFEPGTPTASAAAAGQQSGQQQQNMGVRWGRRASDRIGTEKQDLPRGVLPSRATRPPQALDTRERRRRCDAMGQPDWTLFVTTPRFTFADMAGMTELKWRLQRLVIEPGPALAEARARRDRSGFGSSVLYGPTGSGKAFAVEAVAGQIGSKFVRVCLPELLGGTENDVHERLGQAFELARDAAPCVVLIEGVDRIGERHGRRSQAAIAAAERLGRELDRLPADGSVLVIATAVRPWIMDPALRRNGRFDRLLLVSSPDASARVRILSDRLVQMPLAPDISAGELAMLTEGCSAADLAQLCAEAAQHALVSSKSAGVLWPVAQRDLLRAATHIAKSGDAWFEMANDALAYANAKSDYDSLFDHIRRHVRHVMH